MSSLDQPSAFATLKAASDRERQLLQAVARAHGAEEGLETASLHVNAVRALRKLYPEAAIAELLHALAVLAEMPEGLPWMQDPSVKMAYALGIIGDHDFVEHTLCHGTGRVDSSAGLDGSACNCPGSKGRVITDEAKDRIHQAFPEYAWEPSQGEANHG